MIAALANRCWRAAAAGPAAAFRAALARPQAAQDRLLARWLARDRASAWGRAHGFAGLDPEGYRARHPLTAWEDYLPWIARLAAGGRDVLSCEPVRALLPTGGSGGGAKLVPATPGLLRGFRTAADCWMHALFAAHPAVLDGSAYWSLSPPAFPAARHGALPVGFPDDGALLGPLGALLARATWAVPPAVARLPGADAWRTATCLHLLRARDLRLVSVWSPSFLALLWQEIATGWARLLADSWWARDRRRQRELAALPAPEPSRIWPRLALLSCWTHGASREEAARLAALFPGVALQPKGLLATEGVVSIPWAPDADPVLAATAQVVEFIASDGRVLGAEEVAVGGTYEVALSNGGGLWRYRLGDLVEVTGRIAAAPTLRFLGRTGGVVDRRGEKLHPLAVERAARAVLAAAGLAPSFLLLAPSQVEGLLGYRLFVELAAPADLAPLAATLDAALQADNPHYRHCRALGQLAPLQAVRLPGPPGRAAQEWLRAQVARGRRPGDVKPAVLDASTGWEERFGTS